jgi:hypothetical protein
MSRWSRRTQVHQLRQRCMPMQTHYDSSATMTDDNDGELEIEVYGPWSADVALVLALAPRDFLHLAAVAAAAPDAAADIDAGASQSALASIYHAGVAAVEDRVADVAAAAAADSAVELTLEQAGAAGEFELGSALALARVATEKIAAAAAALALVAGQQQTRMQEETRGASD